jgi:hypothetical protein
MARSPPVRSVSWSRSIACRPSTNLNQRGGRFFTIDIIN